MLTKLEEKLRLRRQHVGGSNILDKNLERRTPFFRQTLRSQWFRRPPARARPCSFEAGGRGARKAQAFDKILKETMCVFPCARLAPRGGWRAFQS